MNNVVKGSSKESKQALFNSCGVIISSQYAEKVYDLLFERAYNALLNDLKKFKVEDLISENSINIMFTIQKYFYLNFYQNSTLFYITIEGNSIKESWVKEDLTKIVALMPEVKESLTLKPKDIERAFEYFVLSNIYDSKSSYTEPLVNISKSDNFVNRYNDLYKLLCGLTNNNSDFLASGGIRSNIKTKKIQAIIDLVGFKMFDTELRMSVYKKLSNSISLNYMGYKGNDSFKRQQKDTDYDKQTFLSYIKLMEDVVFKNKISSL